MLKQKLKLGSVLGLAAMVATPALAQQTGLLGAVSPASRSVQIGTTATAFATILNTSTIAATGCTLSEAGTSVGDFSFQATDPATNAPVGTINTPVDIAPGASQSFVFSITPSATIDGTDVALAFACDGFDNAPVYTGINTLFLSASATPVPDIITITATPNTDQIVDIAGLGNFTAFSAAATNIGADGTFTVSADYLGTNGPVSIALCETDSATGACLANPSDNVQSSMVNGGVSTYGVFALRDGDVPFDPVSNRVRLRFTSNNTLIAGETGVAIRGTGTDLVVGNYTDTADGFSVNGVTYLDGATTYTRVLLGGTAATASQLKPGQRVRVLGTKVDGAADTIAIDKELIKGPITAIAAGALEVAGQSVGTDTGTIFDGRTLSTLLAGDYVEIDGVFDAFGIIQASRIAYIPGGLTEAEEIAATGIVSSHNPDLKTFTLQNLNVTYSGAQIDDGFGTSGFANGDYVVVKSTAALTGLSMNASKIEPTTADGETVGEPGIELEIEGFVDRYVSAQDFDINGQAIATSTSTVFESGTAADLTLNVMAQVEGVVDANKVLQASKVSFERLDDATALPSTVRNALSLSLADERKALATYAAVLDRYGSNTAPFANIRNAEETHRNLVLDLYDTYDIPVPGDTTIVDPIVQTATLAELCQVGVDAEIANIALYDDTVLPAVTAYADITDVMNRLRNASADSHLPAFRNCAP